MGDFVPGPPSNGAGLRPGVTTAGLIDATSKVRGISLCAHNGTHARKTNARIICGEYISLADPYIVYVRRHGRRDSAYLNLISNDLANPAGEFAQKAPCFRRDRKYPLTSFAICNIVITDCDMTLGEKLRYLREVEGALRGLDRELSQAELARLIQTEQGKGISQSYLSQIESGARPHLTNSTRMLLARFFKVHPGYLVDDPEGFQNELLSDLGAVEDKLDLYLVSGAERFARDAELHHALLTVAKHRDSRMCLILLGNILENQGLAERLIEVLRAPAVPAPKTKRR